MTNRCISYIEQIEREAEHAKRVERVKRSDDVYNAALIEANEQGVVLTRSDAAYTLSDHRHAVKFYAVTNTVFRQIIGTSRGEVVPNMPETDIFSVLLVFCAGEFLK